MTIYANREVSNRASERNNKRILYRFDGVARKNKEKLTTLVSLIISNKQRSINDAVHKLFYLYNQSIRYYFDPCRASRSSSIQPGYNLDTTWIQPGYYLYLDTTLIQHGYYLDTTWIQSGYYLDTTWIQPGYYLDTTSIRVAHPALLR